VGSVRSILDGSKSVLASYTYTPYGQLNAAAGLPLTIGFTGHYFDAETGMYFAPFRYFMPGSGRVTWMKVSWDYEE
jgi:hypothetical protein